MSYLPNRLLRVLFAIASLVLMLPAINSATGEDLRAIARRHPVVKTLAPTGDLDASTHLRLALGLPLRNPAELDQLLEELYDPVSPRFRHYLTPEQFTERFGPTERDYQRVVDFVVSHGLTVTGKHSNRVLLEAEGTAQAVQEMLKTRIAWFKHPTERRAFYSILTDAVIPADLPIQDIQGLDNYQLPKPMSLRRAVRTSAIDQAQTGSAPGGSFRGYDFRAAYAPTVRLTGTGQVVGLLEFDGYYTNDIALYESDSGIRSVPLQNVLLDGFTGAAGAQDPEVSLDIEMAIAMAPGLSKVVVYEGMYGDSILSRMANDNVAKQLSSSWTFPISSTTAQLFAQLAVQGQSLFQASGDVDAYYADIPQPSDSPSVTVVGGTMLTTTGPGGAWASEVTWNWYNFGLGFGGSSGGISPNYNLPYWQKNVSMTLNQGSTVQRNLPDVALIADNIWVRDKNGSTEVLAGTSAAAPLWAGFTALINQQAKALGGTNVGFLNPALYTIGKGAKYATSFHDVTVGNNTNHHSPTHFFAVAGYDLCTGWGTPRGQGLINALTGVTNVAPAFNTNNFTLPFANVGHLYSGSIAGQASDPDPGDKLKFLKTSGPGWLTISANGSLSGTPGITNIGTNTFGVKVTDAGGLSATATMHIAVVGLPSFVTDPFTEPNANAGVSYAGTLSSRVTDPNPGVTLSFSKIGGPGWLSVGPDGSLAGTPGESDSGTNSFLVGVRDSAGFTNSATMLLLVNGTPFFFAPAILASPAEAAQPYSGSIASLARDPNVGDLLSFSKLNGAAWLNVATNGAISGTPGYTDGGTNVFVVKVTDTGGLSNTAQLFIYVALPTPVVLSIEVQQAQVILSWNGTAAWYQVQSASNLTLPEWVDVGSVTNAQTLVLPLTNSTLFYRVESK